MVTQTPTIFYYSDSSDERKMRLLQRNLSGENDTILVLRKSKELSRQFYCQDGKVFTKFRVPGLGYDVSHFLLLFIHHTS